jgi:DNA-3-methyladenine glycosylase
MKLGKRFFEGHATEVAPALLGKVLKFNGFSGIIVEAEAYADDGASHAAKRTRRSEPLFEKYGTTYIYLNYGMYHLFNFTCNKEGPGGVLVRALEPVDGVDNMMKNRKIKDKVNLCNGPGKLCQALGITMGQHDKELGEIELEDVGLKPKIVKATRVGISFSKNLKWRYYIKGNSYISKK